MTAAGSLLLLAALVSPQDVAPPELVVPTEDAEPVEGPNGERLVLLDDELAFLMDLEGGGLVAAVEAEGRGRWWHAVFSRDGDRVLVSTADGAVALLDGRSGSLLSRLPRLGNTTPPWKVHASPELDRVAHLTRTRVRLRDLEGGDEIFSDEVLGGLGVSADARSLFLGSRGKVDRVDPGNPVRIRQVASGSWRTIAPLGGMRLLLSGAHRLRTIDYETGEAHEVRLDGRPWTLVGVADDDAIAVVQESVSIPEPSAVRAFALPDLEPLWEVERAFRAHAPAGSGVVVIDGWKDGVRVHDLRTGEELWRVGEWDFYLGTHGPSVVAGELLLSADPHGDLVRVEPRTGEVLGPAPFTPRHVVRTGVLASGVPWALDEEGGLHTVDPRTGEELAHRRPAPPLVRVVSERDRIVAVDGEGRAGVLDGADLDPYATFEAGERVLALPGGERVVAHGEGVDGARLIRVTDGDVERVVGEDAGPLSHVAASADGTVLAALDGSDRPHLWRGGDVIALQDAPASVRSVAIDPAGRWLALGFSEGSSWEDDPAAQVHDTVTGARLRELKLLGDFAFGEDVRRLFFDPSGRYLVGTTGDWGMVQVWRSEDWLLVWNHEFGGGNGGWLTPRFDPRGTTFWIDGMGDFTQRVFDLATGEVLADLVGTGIEGPVPGAGVVAAHRRGVLVLLEPDGRVRLERADLGEAGAVVLRGGELTGPPAALRRVFVREDGRLVRGDAFAEER